MLRGTVSILATMKQSYLLAGLMFLTLGTVRAADDTPAAVAEREAAEEREKRLNTRIEDLEKTVQKYQDRMSALNDELRGLRDDIGRLRESNNESQTKENIKRLKDAVEEVDKKRLEDNKKVVAALEELRSFIAKGLAPASAREDVRAPAKGGSTSKPSTTTQKKDSESGYDYTVMDKDTLSGIAAKLRARNIKVTQKQIMEANPDVNWNKLHVNQKIFIPIQ